MHGSMKGTLAAKSATKKVDVVSVGCQTETGYNVNYSAVAARLDYSPDSNGMNPSSNAADHNGTSNGSPSTRDLKHQTGSSENTSEGTIVMTIGKFSTLSDTMCSGPKRVQGVPWRIMVMPKQHVVQKKQQKCMGFFLQCCPDKVYSDAWSCKADAEMRLMSKKAGVTNFVRKTNHVYTSKENDWGYSCFMTWADVLDENQGYIKDDKITLEITVKAEGPKNLMSREEFVKAIDQWYNLAEMQMARGMIDLSLEANGQGLKFCKDKDEDMRSKLEEQKSRLVKSKVLDSINRIENHGGQPKTEPLKPTSLRQALNGAQKTIVSKNGKVVANKRDRKTTLQQIKKKKMEHAAKQEAAQKKHESECEKSDSTPPYSPSTPRYSVSETDADETQLLESPTDRKSHAFPCYSSLYPNIRPCCPAHGAAVELMSDDDIDGDDDEEYSDDYNEDDEQIVSDQEESLHDSSSSLDEAHKVEIGCQTLFTGDDGAVHSAPPQERPQPQPNPRRERHPAGSQGAGPDDVASRFAEEISDENSDLYKKLSAGHSVTAEDHEKIDQWCVEHFGDVSKDLSACGLTIGLCAVTSRRCAETGREFRKMISETFKDEYKLAAKLLVENERQIARIRAVQAGISEAMQKHEIPPGDFQLDLADDAATGSRRKLFSKESLQTEQDCAAFVEQIVGADDYDNVLYPLSECEKSVEQLVKEMGQSKFDICIAEKIQNMLQLKDCDTGLITLLTQLFNYFRTLSEQRDELQKSVEVTRTLFQMKAKNGGLGFKTKQVQDSEKKLAESEQLVKKIGHSYQKELDRNAQLTAQFALEQAKLAEIRKHNSEQIETLTQQLREARNLAKKNEKRAKQEETKNATLLADKLDLEDKLKTVRKEADQIKKKSTEDRNNAKKQKDRDTETIRRLETENAEKEAEKERERGHFEEKLREARTKENKAERERKQAVGNTNTALERARNSESAQIALMYELHNHRFEKAREEIAAGMSEAEKNLKRVHNTQADQDVMKKNLAEWKAASEELEKIVRETKTEYDNSADTVKKGQVLFSHLDLSQPILPTLPKTIRLPPVQVVQPSTSTIPPPTIVTPPAGVIGQPRVSTSSGVGVIGQPPSRPHSQVPGPPGMNGSMAGPSSFNSMKINHGETGTQSQSALNQPPQSSTTATSLWNWSSPLENVTASVFRSSSIDHSRQPQPPSMGLGSWSHQDDFTTQTLNRSMYSNQQNPAVNWANGSGWQRPSSANMAQQNPYGPRSGMPPYFQ